MTKTKQCIGCKKTLPVERFYVNKSTKSGLTCRCKICISEQRKATTCAYVKKGYGAVIENNKKNQARIILEYLGFSMSIKQWSKATGIKESTIRNRIDQEWNMESIVKYYKASIKTENNVEFDYQPINN